MIPHHQGAIDMAKVVLQYGKNEQTRKWANDIIREQAREINEMQEWLKANKTQGRLRDPVARLRLVGSLRARRIRVRTLTRQ